MPSKRSLRLFKKAAKQIPAYRTFLARHGCNPSSIKSLDSFRSSVPLTDKKSYLMKSNHNDLIWSQAQENLLLLCATSGSTGEPYYFPRDEKLSHQYSYIIEDYLRYSSYGQGKTLVLIGFGMGVWIGGIITLRAFEIAVQRLQAPVSILPAGYSKAEIFKALKRLAPSYDQTIIVGYPPFVKEIVDEASGEQIDLPSLNVRFLFAAEAFTETFRNYICEAAGINSVLRDTLNIYGTADIGAMAYETPLSILVRRLVMHGDPLLRRELFRQVEKTPTLAQYNPKFIEFEEVNGEIVLTGDAAMPLVRYAIGDHGGTFDYKYLDKVFKKYYIDLSSEISKAKIGPFVDKKKPFVFVYERKDLAATLQGIIIYPEFIKETLLRKNMHKDFTERFSMSTKYDIGHNQFLQVNIELQKGVKSSTELKNHALKAVFEGLLKHSSEFAEISKTQSARKLLDVVLWPNAHPRYFAPGTKQKWVEKP
ncbi:MAG: phenylacetate--CoA ligase family protein [Candidatus Saccharimonadales bacterium]